MHMLFLPVFVFTGVEKCPMVVLVHRVVVIPLVVVQAAFVIHLRSRQEQLCGPWTHLQ